MMNNKVVKLSSAVDVIGMMNRFELKFGVPPRCIVTTEENRKVIMEWFGFAPEQINVALGYDLREIPFLTPREMMII